MFTPRTTRRSQQQQQQQQENQHFSIPSSSSRINKSAAAPGGGVSSQQIQNVVSTTPVSESKGRPRPAATPLRATPLRSMGGTSMRSTTLGASRSGASFFGDYYSSASLKVSKLNSTYFEQNCTNAEIDNQNIVTYYQNNTIKINNMVKYDATLAHLDKNHLLLVKTYGISFYPNTQTNYEIYTDFESSPCLVSKVMNNLYLLTTNTNDLFKIMISDGEITVSKVSKQSSLLSLLMSSQQEGKEIFGFSTFNERTFLLGEDSIELWEFGAHKDKFVYSCNILDLIKSRMNWGMVALMDIAAIDDDKTVVLAKAEDGSSYLFYFNQRLQGDTLSFTQSPVKLEYSGIGSKLRYTDGKIFIVHSDAFEFVGTYGVTILFKENVLASSLVDGNLQLLLEQSGLVEVCVSPENYPDILYDHLENAVNLDCYAEAEPYNPIRFQISPDGDLDLVARRLAESTLNNPRLINPVLELNYYLMEKHYRLNILLRLLCDSKNLGRVSLETRLAICYMAEMCSSANALWSYHEDENSLLARIISKIAPGETVKSFFKNRVADVSQIFHHFPKNIKTPKEIYECNKILLALFEPAIQFRAMFVQKLGFGDLSVNRDVMDFHSPIPVWTANDDIVNLCLKLFKASVQGLESSSVEYGGDNDLGNQIKSLADMCINSALQLGAYLRSLPDIGVYEKWVSEYKGIQTEVFPQLKTCGFLNTAFEICEKYHCIQSLVHLTCDDKTLIEKYIQHFGQEYVNTLLQTYFNNRRFADIFESAPDGMMLEFFRQSNIKTLDWIHYLKLGRYGDAMESLSELSNVEALNSRRKVATSLAIMTCAAQYPVDMWTEEPVKQEDDDSMDIDEPTAAQLKDAKLLKESREKVYKKMKHFELIYDAIAIQDSVLEELKALVVEPDSSKASSPSSSSSSSADFSKKIKGLYTKLKGTGFKRSVEGYIDRICISKSIQPSHLVDLKTLLDKVPPEFYSDALDFVSKQRENYGSLYEALIKTIFRRAVISTDWKVIENVFNKESDTRVVESLKCTPIYHLLYALYANNIGNKDVIVNSLEYKFNEPSLVVEDSHNLRKAYDRENERLELVLSECDVDGFIQRIIASIKRTAGKKKF